MKESHTRISSRSTFLYKRILPFLWFGALAFILGESVFSFFSPATRNRRPLQILVIPVIMTVFGYLLFKNLVFDLADDVYDYGDHLLIRRGGREEEVGLSEIINISYAAFSSPARVTLSLRRETLFGREISFCPPVLFAPFDPFKKSPVIDDLIVRVDEARNTRAR